MMRIGSLANETINLQLKSFHARKQKLSSMIMHSHLVKLIMVYKHFNLVENGVINTPTKCTDEKQLP